MAILINPPSHGKGTSGERRLAARLEALLEDDYLCWYDVPIGPQRQHPDFVVLHPSRGLLLLEVKDWKIDTLWRIDKSHVDLLLESETVKRVTNPLDQARSYCNAVVNCLSADPQLRDHDGNHRGKFCLPYGYGVVLTNITRAQWNAALPEEAQDLVLPARFVICKDEMTESIGPLEFQERLWHMLHYHFGRPLTLPQIERVRWHLFPEVRINVWQTDFLSGPGAIDSQDAAATIPEIVRVMDLQQEKLARSLGAGHRVIHGVAGSGKTLILGYRCLHLARTTQKPILVLCYNRTLAAWLRSFVASRGLEDKVRVSHFHGWCKAQFRTYHVETIASDRPMWENLVESVMAGVDRGRIPRAQYGAVMIDEGHDFAPEWFRLVVQMVDPVSDSLLLLYDDAQSIYRKAGGLKFSLSSVGIKAAGRTTILRLNYRNTRQILAFAYSFARSFIAPQAADDDHIPIIEPQAAGASGPAPAFRLKPTIGAEIDYAARCIRKWQQEGEALSEIAVVCASGQHGRLMKDRLARAGIDSLWMASASDKSAYVMGENRVSILSAHSSKGLEFKCVLFIGLGHLTDGEECDQARLLYVGMTRAREKLILTASATNPFTERLQLLAAA